MIILTNKWNAPDAVVNAMNNDGYSSTGDISTTTLIGAPQVRMLRKQFDITVDVRDQFYMLLGSAAHAILESSVKGLGGYLRMLDTCKELDKGNEKDKSAAAWMRERAKTMYKEVLDLGIFVERRLEVEVDGMVISGAQDIFFSKLKKLQDYKLTTVFSYNNAEDKDEWLWQQNIYAYMLRKNGQPCDSAEIVMLLKDWNKSKSLIDRTYPQAPWHVHKLKVWTDEECESYIKERIRLHRLAEQGVQVDCTPKEQWRRGDSWACKKVGGKRAIGGAIFNDEKAAIAFAETNEYKQGKIEVEHRPGLPNKCINFCQVSSVCPQFKRENEKLNKQIEDEN
jgi:hypothetical protein